MPKTKKLTNIRQIKNFEQIEKIHNDSTGHGVYKIAASDTDVNYQLTDQLYVCCSASVGLVLHTSEDWSAGKNNYKFIIRDPNNPVTEHAQVDPQQLVCVGRQINQTAACNCYR